MPPMSRFYNSHGYTGWVTPTCVDVMPLLRRQAVAKCCGCDTATALEAGMPGMPEAAVANRQERVRRPAPPKALCRATDFPLRLRGKLLVDDFDGYL